MRYILITVLVLVTSSAVAELTTNDYFNDYMYRDCSIYSRKLSRPQMRLDNFDRLEVEPVRLELERVRREINRWSNGAYLLREELRELEREIGNIRINKAKAEERERALRKEADHYAQNGNEKKAQRLRKRADQKRVEIAKKTERIRTKEEEARRLRIRIREAERRRPDLTALRAKEMALERHMTNLNHERRDIEAKVYFWNRTLEICKKYHGVY